MRQLSELVGEPDLSKVVKAVANSISNPVEIRNMQKELDLM